MSTNIKKVLEERDQREYGEKRQKIKCEQILEIDSTFNLESI